MTAFDVPGNLAELSNSELQQHAQGWARLAADRALTADERTDLAIRVRVALQQSAASAAESDSRFAIWSGGFGIATGDVDAAIARWTRRTNSC
jgi:hypothetical protein